MRDNNINNNNKYSGMIKSSNNTDTSLSRKNINFPLEILKTSKSNNHILAKSYSNIAFSPNINNTNTKGSSKKMINKFSNYFLNYYNKESSIGNSNSNTNININKEADNKYYSNSNSIYNTQSKTVHNMKKTTILDLKKTFNKRFTKNLLSFNISKKIDTGRFNLPSI